MTTNAAFGNTNHSPIATKENTVYCSADLCMTKTTKRLSNMKLQILMTPTVFILEYQKYHEFIMRANVIRVTIYQITRSFFQKFLFDNTPNNIK